MRNTFPKRALQDFCEHCCSWGIIRKCLTLKGFLPQEEMQKIMSCQQAFMKQENPPQSLWGKKKWVLVNQFIVNYCVYSTWPNTTLAIWGNENRVALLSLPLFAPLGRYPPGDLLPEVRGWGVHPACGWAPPHGRLLLLGRGSLGHRGVRGVSHEKHTWVRGALSQRTRIRHKRNYKWQTVFQRYSGFSGWLLFF